MPTAEDMDVQMRDGLAAVGPAVDDQAIAVLSQAEFFGHFAGFEQDMSQGLAVCGFGFGDAWKDFFGEN